MKKGKNGIESQEKKTFSFKKTSIGCKNSCQPIILHWCDCWSVNKHTWASIKGYIFFPPTQLPSHIESCIEGYQGSWEFVMNYGRLKLYETFAILHPRNLKKWYDMTCLTLANNFSSQVSLEPGSSSIWCSYSLLLPSSPPLNLFYMLISRIWVTAVYTTTIAKELLGLSATMCTCIIMHTQTICLH